ncbi:MAG: outer membrane protein assembly factor BamD [Deltaproteobacteria bacterium CG_4_10_14_3_um_filter_60_8]|nr:MAG: outer membrane protein assembly factor BamD [Deltaproteobacteria bacterium CG_4_10_14_3_um_filter_60_8]
MLPLLAALLFASCATHKVTEDQDPVKLTAQAMDAFNRGRYSTALEDFKDVRDQFPFSKYSLLAELKSADAHYYMKEYPEARVLYQEFESKHPTNEAMSYVLFQIGMCHFKEIDTIDREPGAAHEAIGVFTRLVRTYPQSSYVVEAKFRVKAAREFLAEHELYVARFYLRTGALAAAISRLELLLAQYPDANAAPKAEAMLADARARLAAGPGHGLRAFCQRFLPFF